MYLRVTLKFTYTKLVSRTTKVAYYTFLCTFLYERLPLVCMHASHFQEQRLKAYTSLHSKLLTS